MTAFLLRLFKCNNSGAPESRSKIGKLSSVLGIICNLLLFVLKLLVGIVSGSVSITADAMNNLSDASSSVVTLLGFKLSEKPADADHPYGHARFEYLSGLAVAAIIIIIGFELAKTSVEKIIRPTSVVLSVPLVVVLISSILIKLWLSAFNRKLGKMIGSSALEATAADSRNDVIATAAVLVAAVAEYFTRWHIDGYMGLAVALFILYSGAVLAKETISPLLGEAASPELRQLIVDTVKSYPKILGYHDLMVHDYGPGQRFGSLHVEMDCNEDPLLCHEIIDDIERECLEKHNIHLVIHYDPVVTDDEALSIIRKSVQNWAETYDSRLTIHDFRMVSGSGHTNLVFDVALPDDLSKEKKAIKTYIEESLRQQTGEVYYAVITFDPAAFNED